MMMSASPAHGRTPRPVRQGSGDQGGLDVEEQNAVSLEMHDRLHIVMEGCRQTLSNTPHYRSTVVHDESEAALAA
ncbi:hypothetical protein BRAO285_500041 [Bradyrhizobium sp. ORS 285]|nr:hypothetical protein BRAO285_500041 [Bradyrhizobium sp. ORS 285]